MVNMPRNALTHTYSALARRYAAFVAPQGWGFFAPNPSRSDLHVIFRVRDHGVTLLSGDVTSALSAQLHGNPFTSSETLYESLFHASNIALRIGNTEPLPPLPEQQSTRERLAEMFVSREVNLHVHALLPLLPRGARIEYAAQRFYRSRLGDDTTPLEPPTRSRIWHSTARSSWIP
jgi:hypothetical protein